MAKHGTANAFERSIIPLRRTERSRLKAPGFLKPDEFDTFAALADAHTHLVQADAPLLAAYCTAILKAGKLAHGKRILDWDRSIRIALMLATKLRLTPQSTVNPETLGRRRKDQVVAAGDLADEMRGYRDEDGEEAAGDPD